MKRDELNQRIREQGIPIKEVFEMMKARVGGGTLGTEEETTIATRQSEARRRPEPVPEPYPRPHPGPYPDPRPYVAEPRPYPGPPL